MLIRSIKNIIDDHLKKKTQQDFTLLPYFLQRSNPIQACMDAGWGQDTAALEYGWREQTANTGFDLSLLDKISLGKEWI